MDKFDKGRIAKKIIVVVLYACSFYIAFLTALSLPFGVVPNLLLSALGLAIDWLAIAFFHEGGHFLFAKLSGFEVVRFSCLFFTFDKSSSKRFSFGFGDKLGETAVLPKGTENVGKRYSKVVFGGILGSAVAFLVLFAAFVVSAICSSPLIFLFCGVPLSIAILVVNCLPGYARRSDGEILAYLTSDDVEFQDEKDAISKSLTIVAELGDGKTYAEIDPESFSIGENVSEENKAYFALLKLRRAEEVDDVDGAVEALSVLEGCDFLDEEARVEVLGGYLYLGDEEKIAEYEDVLSLCDDCSGSLAMRVLIYHAKKDGDSKYVSTALSSAKKICDASFIKGDGAFNKKMIEKIT